MNLTLISESLLLWKVRYLEIVCCGLPRDFRGDLDIIVEQRLVFTV